MMRRSLLFLSRQVGLRHWMETSAIAQPLRGRFVAGATLDDAVAVCRRINQERMAASLDHLGENVTSLDEVPGSLDAYLKALDQIADLRLRATVSIKLTQFGMDLSEDYCRESVAALVERAKAIGTMVEVDMESSEHVDRTLRLVTGMHARYGSVRAVIQAYLHRSADDIRMLCDRKIPVRLCKGAYDEPPEVAFTDRHAVDENYVRLGQILLAHGVDPAFASHDERMLALARAVGRERFEYQMLYGVRRELQRRLVADGYRLRLYVPYGQAWYPYLMRRLAERPANVWFAARSLVGN